MRRRRRRVHHSRAHHHHIRVPPTVPFSTLALLQIITKSKPSVTSLGHRTRIQAYTRPHPVGQVGITASTRRRHRGRCGTRKLKRRRRRGQKRRGRRDLKVRGLLLTWGLRLLLMMVVHILGEPGWWRLTWGRGQGATRTGDLGWGCRVLVGCLGVRRSHPIASVCTGSESIRG